MRRRVTLTVPAIAHITGFVDVPDVEPVEGEELTEEQLQGRADDAAAAAGTTQANALRLQHAMAPIMTGQWPEVMGGASIEVVFVGDGDHGLEVDVHPIA